MSINRNVVEDLLPVYLSGEASKDTNQLVEEYLATDPGLQSVVEKLVAVETGLPILAQDFNGEIKALKQTRRLVNTQAWLLGLAIFFSLLPLSIRGSTGSGVQWAWADFPAGAAVVAVIGLSFWAAYFRLRYRLRTELFN